MSHVTVVANNKGGVGKSGTLVQLAAGLARAGKSVLVVDMDPQANATRRFGIEWDESTPIATMAEVLADGRAGAGAGVALGCGWQDGEGNPTSEALLIDVLPARFDLINRESEAGAVGASRRLTRVLEGWSEEYDVILIDTPPSLGHLVQMAFAAANTVLIPADPNFDSVEAAIRVKDFVIQHAADLANPNLEVGGVVVTRRKNTSEQDFQLESLKQHFGDLVWRIGGLVQLSDATDYVVPSAVPEWVRFAEADASAVSLSAWGDLKGRQSVAIFDSITAQYIDRFLKKGAN